MEKPIILSCIILIFDQLSKYLTDKLLPYGSSLSVVSYKNIFNIVNVRNTGAAFSIFQGQNLIFTILIAVFLGVIIFLLRKNHNKLSTIYKYAICLVLSGGFGNLIDRIFRGYVIDFLDFGINAIRWPAFNIADSSICVAVGLIIISMLLNKKEV